MPGIIIGILIVAYTGFIIYRKSKDIKEGKSCCSGCSSCPSKEKCNSN
ncbi:MAG TPA: FeoB-associated Cys-rich membrane protein [Clostridiales bacterium]|nr:FeoB-associated Cys-rich membrane protein [Clostridiales bacterium]